MSTARALSYCAQQVRSQDHDRFLTCLFAPEATREALFALYAFNLEIAKTVEMVSEAMLGRIRLQWWRESLDGVFAGQPRQHAVLQPLAEAVAVKNLSREAFNRLIDARERDLDSAPLANFGELEAYASETSVPLVEIALEMLGVSQSDGMQAVARHVGLAWALTGLLRALPFHARQRRMLLPSDLLGKHHVSLADIFELRPSPGLTGAVAEVASIAEDHLRIARRQRDRIPREALPALLIAVLAGHHLRLLRQSGNNPFASRVQQRSAGAAWRLTWAHLRGRY